MIRVSDWNGPLQNRVYSIDTRSYVIPISVLTFHHFISFIASSAQNVASKLVQSHQFKQVFSTVGNTELYKSLRFNFSIKLNVWMNSLWRPINSIGCHRAANLICMLLSCKLFFDRFGPLEVNRRQLITLGCPFIKLASDKTHNRGLASNGIKLSPKILVFPLDFIHCMQVLLLYLQKYFRNEVCFQLNKLFYLRLIF